MSLQIRRGTNAERTTITPVAGELIYTTDTKAVFVGDGTTVGGINISVGGTGNITANLIGDVTGNLSGTTVSVTGNIDGGNLNTGGLVSAAGNVTGNYILGNGALLTGVITSSTTISNGTSNVAVVGSGANITVGVAGTSNVVVWASTGEYVTGVVSATGNITGGNVNVNGGGVISVAGNVQAGNLRTAGLISASGTVTGSTLVGAAVSGNLTGTTASLSGTITGGNVLTGGEFSATGNVTGDYIIGNGAFLTNVTTTATSIVNGSSSVEIGSSGSNVTVDVGGTANVTVFAATGIVVTGIASVTANVQSGNLRTTGVISSTGNITTGANLNISDGIYTSTISSSANITGGNIFTGGLISATGNIESAANVSGVTFKGNVSGTTVSASGNITGGNINTTGTVIGALISSTGNLTAGNITSGTQNVTGNLNVTGNVNVTGNLVYANVTDLVISDPLVYIGANNTGNVYDLGMVVSWDDGLYQHGGWVRDATDGTWKLFGNVVPEPNSTIDFTNAIYQPMRAGAIAATTGAFSSTLSATGNITGGNALIGGIASVAGNILAGNILGGANVNAITHTGTTVSVSGNVQGGNLRTAGLISATGNITAGNLTVSTGTISLGNVVNNNANGVGNIGSSGGYFNTVFALATSAQYADLAENYAADAAYEPGTVVSFGGTQEVTISNEVGTTGVAGVVSTNPSYLMNAGLTSEFVVAVALQGRVPTKVLGTVRKGDLLVAAVDGHATVDNNARAGSIVGKALQDFDGDRGIIEVVVGRA